MPNLMNCVDELQEGGLFITMTAGVILSSRKSDGKDVADSS